jgi:hypothetical protein
MNSPTKPLVPGRPAVGHEKQHGQRREPRHGVGHPAVVRDHAAVYAVVQHADAKEQRAGDETVRDHLHHGAFHAQRGAAAAFAVAEHREGQEQAQRDEAHVRDRRVGDQLLHVGLDQRHEADVDHGDQRQRDDQPIQRGRGVRRDRQAESG